MIIWKLKITVQPWWHTPWDGTHSNLYFKLTFLLDNILIFQTCAGKKKKEMGGRTHIFMLDHNRYSGTVEDTAAGFSKTTELTEQNRIVPSEDTEDGPVAMAWFVITTPPHLSKINLLTSNKCTACSQMLEEETLEEAGLSRAREAELLLHNTTCTNQLITASPVHSSDSTTGSCKRYKQSSLRLMAPLTDGVFPVDSIATTWAAVNWHYMEQALLRTHMLKLYRFNMRRDVRWNIWRQYSASCHKPKNKTRRLWGQEPSLICRYHTFFHCKHKYIDIL